jgi:hypothetical protein
LAERGKVKGGGLDMDERRHGFWSTLPGILTGMAALITAATGGYLAYNRTPGNSAAPQASPSQAAAPAEPAPAALAEPRPANPAPAEVRATVVDPDGWTNLRSGPSTSAAIVGRLNEGEIFWTKPRHAVWWPARTAGGVEGYVHRSRVRLNP